MANYDYGFRGAWDTDPRMFGDRRRSFGRGGERDRSGGVPTHRVTARYNMDYIRPEGDRYPRNMNPYGGDAPNRIGDERSFRHPYITRGGTWTSKGAPRPIAYDHRVFGPDFGGRYPDEL
jgi:hypothetical protein